MPVLRIPPGVVRGESKAMIPGRWWDTNLIRWQQGLMKPIGGWERLNASPLGSVPRAGHVWLDSLGDRNAAFVCDHKVYYEADGVYTDLTPPDFVDANSSSARGYGSGDYSVANYGVDDEARGGSGLGALDPKKPVKFGADNWADELLFSTSADGRLFVWNPTTPEIAPAVAAGVPPFLQAFLVTDEAHLMIFGYQGFPNRVAWSDRENRTGWDFARVEGQAGFYDLQGAGRILSASKIPGGILVFTTTDVWLGRYIGAPYFYGFNRIAEGCAPVSPHAIGIAGAKAYWLGKRTFWKYENGIVTPLPNTLGLDPFETIMHEVAPRRVTAGFSGAYPEIWFFYPEDQGLQPIETENNRYIIYNFDEGWWADGWMHRSMYFSSPIDGFPIASDEGFLYQHETGYLAEGQPRLDMVYAEIGTISFDDGANNWTVHQCQIDSCLGPESVKFDFKGRQKARGGPEISLQTGLIPRADGFLDTHFTARDFSMKILGRMDGPWALGAFNFSNVVKRGPV